ncbi:MAG: 4-hydroxy-3-methylbut-2-enyl diphosphate reductase, partial [Clostridiales bacterium]|nr:4-hydroxy-3-methylbut-2-enyl diphosphate reductase [Clostridiales bacterium]
MPIEVAAHAGFCMGVRRAVEEALKVAESGVPSCTLGELAHNPTVVEMLAVRGVPPIHRVEEADGRQVLIRSHGVSPDVLEALSAAGCSVIDLTCPFVAKLHRIVADGTADGTPVIMVGEAAHPEVQGTCGWAKGPVYVVATPEEAMELPKMERAIAAAQTTYPPERWEAIASVLRSKVEHLEEHCTICNATPVRQREAKELAARADAMIVIGGRTSANTQKLYAACKALCPRTILVERAAEIPPAFANTDSEFIGITAGASTPAGSLEEVLTHMTDMQNTDFNMDAVVASMTRIRAGQT